MNYFVYIKDIVGVEINKEAFKWSYGSVAPKSDEEQFKKCKIKIYLTVVPDDEVPINCGRKFGLFTSGDDGSVSYDKRFLGLKLKCNVRVKGNCVQMICGKTYFRFRDFKFMNIHSPDYVLTAITEGLLLKNGLCTLYASSVNMEKEKRCALFFGAPNTGKTITVMRLCNSFGAKLISEDFAVSDGELVYGAPWTHTHRTYDIDGLDSQCSIEENPCRVTDVVVLEKGTNGVSHTKEENNVMCLQRYGMCYMKSPYLTALGYFNSDFDIEKMAECEQYIIGKLLDRCNFARINCSDAMDFADNFISFINGK